MPRPIRQFNASVGERVGRAVAHSGRACRRLVFVAEQVQQAMNGQQGHLVLRGPSCRLCLTRRRLQGDHNVAQQARVVLGEGQHIGGFVHIPMCRVQCADDRVVAEQDADFYVFARALTPQRRLQRPVQSPGGIR